jgi:hypothetical protein
MSFEEEPMSTRKVPGSTTQRMFLSSIRSSIVESGFDAIPESRRAKAFTMNSNGWNGQAENIRKFLAGFSAR